MVALYLITMLKTNTICRPVCLQQLVESVRLSSESWILQWTKLMNKEVALNFVTNGISCAESFAKNVRKDLYESVLSKSRA